MMKEEEIAWVVLEFANGRLQRDIGEEIGYTSSTVCQYVRAFCERWSVNVYGRMIYGNERRHYAGVAVFNYSKQYTRISKPPLNTSAYIDRFYANALDEHAWLLRAEGLSFREIGRRFEISGTRAQQRVYKFSARMNRAMRRTHFKIYPGKEPTRDWLMLGTRRSTSNV